MQTIFTVTLKSFSRLVQNYVTLFKGGGGVKYFPGQLATFKNFDRGKYRRPKVECIKSYEESPLKYFCDGI